jgi:hypothetical protein
MYKLVEHGFPIPWIIIIPKKFGSIPSGKHTKNYGKSPFSMGKSTISMVIFNSYVDITRG